MRSGLHTLATGSLRKEYPGTIALRDVSLSCSGGKIRALLGKNGAGKSTLVRLLGGAEQPTSGSILLDGTRVSFRSPGEALACGIATVHQELSLIRGLSVAENIFLGRLPRRRGFIDWGAARARAETLLADLGLDIDVRRPAGDLGLASQQMIEIAKAMSHSPAVLMLDEPTSALAHRETGRLFTLLKGLASQGVVILYITHRLAEIHLIADEASVLRNGELVGTIPIGEAGAGVIASMMFGEELAHRRRGGCARRPGRRSWRSEASRTATHTATSRSRSTGGRSSASPACLAPEGRNSSADCSGPIRMTAEPSRSGVRRWSPPRRSR